MIVEGQTLAAILAMVAVTYATRIGGVLIADRLMLGPRLKAAFDAIPLAVLTAVIAPMALATGPAETLAAIVTALAALRLPLIGTVAVGAAAVVLFRAVLG
ncbi:AzlD family protein [Prosthecodimorpha staleyi]|uniref:AzlD domain-containing protein n=1 Tax=Prosthecodimorpha staleyi TaxID=2840188 RepID=A0A947GBT8_9HYPH|nr:AzlD domain-containing protein [Prosthecodimorpha staleyi]MBT9288426.1 AzlD domain-containing protein [Prosthecodimorpha staleyi]